MALLPSGGGSMGGGATAAMSRSGSADGHSSRASPAVGLPGGHSSSSAAKQQPNNGMANGNGFHPTKPPMPLSFMTSRALDMSSVERRGQPTSVREPVRKKSRPHDLEEAPTYMPTDDEWADPFEYIRKITPQASKYGICKIIPPASWNPPFAINTSKFHFRTRKQELNSVEGSTRANLTYLDALAKFHKQQGTNLNRLPYVDKKPLDLYKLKKAVEARGGFERVCKLKKWAEIGRDLGYSGKIMSSLSTSLKNSYQRWLWPYEEFLRLAKPGVQQQLEFEYGGPLTPSPAPSPMKRPSNNNTPSSLRGDSPAQQASDALQGTLNGHSKDNGDVVMTDAPAQSGPSTFRSLVSNGPAPAAAGFANTNRQPEGSFTPPPKQFGGSPLSSVKNTPEYRPSGLGPAHVLKRQMSCESLDSGKLDNGAEKEDGENGSRRSKRLRKENIPIVAGSHMTLFRSSVPRMPKDESAAPGEKCEQCGKGDEIGFLAQCGDCGLGYHGTCLDPPLKQNPDPEWSCPRCLVGDNQFGFEEGGLYSLRQFQEKAHEFKQSYFENRLPWDPELKCYRPVTEDDVEREFWRLVANLEENVEVEYGADIHVTTHGSGFPTAEKHPLDPYSRSPWNLNLLPLHPDSLFRYIKSDISGMTVPWVYVGMTFSTFCWHNEDHYAYSANYQHFGDTKTWYGIPGEDAEKFENAMREAVPELFETQPDLLFQLVTLLTPEQLKKAGVRVYAIDQRAGQFVITFPQAYHAGFNHGFNFNEAVNFAPSDWEPFGLDGVERLQVFRRHPCFSHDELLWTAAEGTNSSGLTIQTAKWLAPALKRIQQREEVLRENCVARHLEAAPHACPLNTKGPNANVDIALTSSNGAPNGHANGHADGANGAGVTLKVEDAGTESSVCPLTFEIHDVDVPEEEYQCSHCKSFAYLSRFQCLKSGKVLCLAHAGYHACCDMDESKRFLGENHVLLCRKTSKDMESAYQKVAEKANTPEAWEEKFERLLDEDARPPLKVLRSLMNEGDKIPWDLPSLPNLRRFVEKCQEWVDEALNYTARKPQMRRKSERPQGPSRKEETRTLEMMKRLLEDVERIGFESPEIGQLRERLDSIKEFQASAKRAIDHSAAQTIEAVEELLEEGRAFPVDLPEVENLAHRLAQMKWDQKAQANRGLYLSLPEVRQLLDEAKQLSIQPFNDFLKHYNEQYDAGMIWETKANELIKAETVHYAQLESLSSQATVHNLPVNQATRAQVDEILRTQREAQKQIRDVLERSQNDMFRERPKYSEVVEIMKKLEDLNSKPQGTTDLEREQKKHSDWMRKGKKLFGKTNAPLHILKSHMEYVLERNVDCFDMKNDKPRLPAEPLSREPSPEERKFHHRWEDPRFREVFCICRKTEAGMMIECESCHEWYHGRCLKIARGKVKEDDKFTCPVCDWRVKIPRDAARPKLEDLIVWYEEIPWLPFQPDEEELLKEIIDNAQNFRNAIAPFCNPILSTADAAETQRFYLRKIEGAEILLTKETNFFRQELHRWCKVAPQPPPMLEVSKSTRKPRPTKLQKMFAEHGVKDIEELPEGLRGKAISLRRKQLNAAAAERDAIRASMRNLSDPSPSAHGDFPSGAGGGSSVGNSESRRESEQGGGAGSPSGLDGAYFGSVSGGGAHSPGSGADSPMLGSFQEDVFGPAMRQGVGGRGRGGRAGSDGEGGAAGGAGGGGPVDPHLTGPGWDDEGDNLFATFTGAGGDPDDGPFGMAASSSRVGRHHDRHAANDDDDDDDDDEGEGVGPTDIVGAARDDPEIDARLFTELMNDDDELDPSTLAAADVFMEDQES